jgi:hypothetical protein
MKIHLLLLMLLALISCKEISFREPQPKGKSQLEEVPKSIRGSYLMVDDEGKAKDTLTVTSHGYLTGHNPKEEALLSDSMVLKHFKGYYFLSMNEHPEWLIRVLKKDKNGDLLYMAMDQDEKNFNSFLKRLSTAINIDSLEVRGEKLYQIDPTPKELMGLIKKGFFRTTVLKKVK